MTAPSRRVLFAVLLLVCALAQVGCITFEEPTGPVPNMDQRLYRAQKAVSFRLGDMWVVRPPYEINATGIVLTRTNLSAPAGDVPVDETPAPAPDVASETAEAAQAEATADAPTTQPATPSMEQGVVDMQDGDGGPQPRPAEKLAANQQRLSIDLVTGRATLRDTDGRVYPQQIDRNVTQRIHAVLLSRDWQVKSPSPATDADPVYRYRIDVYNADYRYAETLTWHAPASQPLPAALELFSSTFQVAHRYAYPLSDDVNLLR